MSIIGPVQSRYREAVEVECRYFNHIMTWSLYHLKCEEQ